MNENLENLKIKRQQLNAKLEKLELMKPQVNLMSFGTPFAIVSVALILGFIAFSLTGGPLGFALVATLMLGSTALSLFALRESWKYKNKLYTEVNPEINFLKENIIKIDKQIESLNQNGLNLVSA